MCVRLIHGQNENTPNTKDICVNPAQDVIDFLKKKLLVLLGDGTCVLSCRWWKPAAGPAARLTANELGFESAMAGAQRGLSPTRATATQLSLSDLQLSDYVTAP